MAQFRPKALGALGSYGQNSQTSDIDLPPGFVKLGTNYYMDESGRPTARPSFVNVTTAPGPVAANEPLTRTYRHNRADGSALFVSASTSRVVTGTSTLASIFTLACSLPWQFASLNGRLFGTAFGTGTGFQWWNETTFVATLIASPATPRAIHAAYGRLWAVSGDGWTLHWSDLLDGTNFTAGASGSIDLQRLHTTLRSPAIAVTSFARQIVVLCRDQILVLGLANDLNPSNVTTPLFLQDNVPGIGCIARDTAVQAGDDVLFLSDSGVRSLRRSLAEKQGPASLIDISELNTSVLRRNVVAEGDQSVIAACWHPDEAWYQLFFPTSKEVWVFDFSAMVPEINLPRTTVWTMGSRQVYHGVRFNDGRMYYGAVGGVSANITYDSTDSYTMALETGWMSLESPESIKHFKNMLINLKGGSTSGTGTIKWYVDFNDAAFRSATFALPSAPGGAEYGIGEFNIGEYGLGLAAAEGRSALGGSAKFIKFVIEIPVSGYAITVNNVQTFFNQGRVRY